MSELFELACIARNLNTERSREFIPSRVTVLVTAKVNLIGDPIMDSDKCGKTRECGVNG